MTGFARRDLLLLVAIVVAVGGFATGALPAWLERTPNTAKLLRSYFPSDRLAAIQWMDRDQLRAELPELLRTLKMEQDPIVRREVVRQLGYTGDPSVLPVLVDELKGEHADAAIESMGYLATPEACRHVLAALGDRKLHSAASATLFDTGWRCLDHLTLETDEERRIGCYLGVETFPALERYLARSGCGPRWPPG